MLGPRAATWFLAEVGGAWQKWGREASLQQRQWHGMVAGGAEVLGAVQPQAEVRRWTDRGEPRERLPSALSSGLGGLSVGVTGSEARAMGSVASSPFPSMLAQCGY